MEKLVNDFIALCDKYGIEDKDAEVIVADIDALAGAAEQPDEGAQEAGNGDGE